MWILRRFLVHSGSTYDFTSLFVFEVGEMQFLKNFLAEEDGPTAVEYAVMLAAILIVCLIGIAAVGTQTNALFENATTEMQKHGM